MVRRTGSLIDEMQYWKLEVLTKESLDDIGAGFGTSPRKKPSTTSVRTQVSREHVHQGTQIGQNYH